MFGPLGRAPPPKGSTIPPTGRLLGYGAPFPGMGSVPGLLPVQVLVSAIRRLVLLLTPPPPR